MIGRTYGTHMGRTRCNVCDTFWDYDELRENYRGMLECPDCGTELEKNTAHGGNVKRDQFSHKK